ncbi:chymotrypsinogen A-like isoform X2 [Paramacrobiotus metropolitanus]|uniref:chymotrypsinogen A-like isoform X2 n=1 Tax=Paramacrobiotus metropolitanus TaxID=2943436 RepID=UPI0024460F12|nr:chymotrypsinogen A-like isoform X2 [Paramacrobiotus metropolitanus]
MCRCLGVVLSCVLVACHGGRVEIPDDYDTEPVASRSSDNQLAFVDYGEAPASMRAAANGLTIPVDYPDGSSSLDGDDEEGSPSAPRIINGNPAPAHEFKFIVSLRKNGQHICGGSLLADYKSVITAAHCVYKYGFKTPASILTVAVGIRRRSGVDASHVLQVGRVSVHPSYDEDSIRNDIAILHLSQSAAGISQVATVKLPPANREPAVGTLLHTAGWGATATGLYPGTGAETLLKTTLKVVDRQRCSRVFGSVPESQICTENDRSGTCSGDSGGPLVNRRGDGDYLVGLTSYGVNGCTLGTADAFTKVSHYSDWIRQTANGESPAGGGSQPDPSPGGGGSGGGSTGNCFLLGTTLFCQGGGGIGGGILPGGSGQQCYIINGQIHCISSNPVLSGSRQCLVYGSRIYCYSG